MSAIILTGCNKDKNIAHIVTYMDKKTAESMFAQYDGESSYLILFYRESGEMARGRLTNKVYRDTTVVRLEADKPETIFFDVCTEFTGVYMIRHAAITGISPGDTKYVQLFTGLYR
jgi:hypothetical protein